LRILIIRASLAPITAGWIMSDPFRIRDHVSNAELVKAMYRLDSAAARASFPHQRDLAYGPELRHRLDLFFPHDRTGPLPIHMIVQGGFWQGNRKDDYAFLAETVCGAGAIAAVIGYGSMPDIRMAELVADIRLAAFWLSSEARAWGGDPARLSASGHAGGAQLCSFLLARGPHEAQIALPPVKSLLLVSTIADLRPAAHSVLQAEIALTDEEVAAFSPFVAVPAGETPVTLAIGGLEPQAFQIMTQDYAFALEDKGVLVERLTVPALNHLDIVSEMGRSGTAMAGLVRETIARSA
jgi:arylformamidase